MAEKKTRKITRVDGTEKKSAPAKKASTKKAAPTKERKVKPAKEKAPEGSATGLRVAAFILWFVGIAMEVAAILLLNGTIYLGGNELTWLLVALGVDLVAVVIASQLWKKANRIDPASEKNKVKFFLWNNLGVIMSIIAFLPILILLLKNKDLDAKTKKIASIVAACALAVSVGTSIDYNPISAEEKTAQMEASEALNIEEVYWSTFGKKYHYDEDCQHIRNSDQLYAGTVEQAVEANRTDLCKTCYNNYQEAYDEAYNAAFDAAMNGEAAE